MPPAPAPMAAMAATMPAPMTAVPMSVMAPAHFFRFEVLDFVLIGDGGMRVRFHREPFILTKRLRRQRRGPRACGERGGSGRNAKGEFQKVPALHDISSLLHVNRG
jgi:hypothetical protein